MIEAIIGIPVCIAMGIAIIPMAIFDVIINL